MSLRVIERPRPGEWVRCQEDVRCRWGPCRCGLIAGHAGPCVCPHGYERKP